MTDHEILDLYFARDERAISSTALQYGAPLTRLSMRFVSRQDAEECVSDTYLSAWNHIPPARPGHLFAWLAKVCRNLTVSRMRWDRADKRSADLVEFSEELAQCLPDERIERERTAEEIGRAISDFLRTLPAEKRILFLRRYWFGDSLADAAERMGMTESNAKVTLYRLRGQLKEYLEKEGIAL